MEGPYKVLVVRMWLINLKSIVYPNLTKRWFVIIKTRLKVSANPPSKSKKNYFNHYDIIIPNCRLILL